ncbi:MAG: YbjN domain-containing protein [Alphaproteobacteria bacterium]|nr:YbjN domain-containing protein [Alphaproteobacteria bacterium]MCY4229573.1 YbjN domain-containing protein [Alphaproteobacteria bacterium]MCY4320184.1 YbjN domain-containing protein [Alphaproteobacteria bacterium]
MCSQWTSGAQGNPVDLVEDIVRARDWVYSRDDSRMIAAELQGCWGETSVCAAWHPHRAIMQVAAACRLPVPLAGTVTLLEMLAYANGMLEMGHFCFEQDASVLCFRHAVPLRGVVASRELLDYVLSTATNGLDQFYPAFQHALWGGKPPAKAVAAAMIQPIGEA